MPSYQALADGPSFHARQGPWASLKQGYYLSLLGSSSLICKGQWEFADVHYILVLVLDIEYLCKIMKK